MKSMTNCFMGIGLCALVWSLPASGEARTFYADAAAAADGTGSRERPFRTLEAARDAIRSERKAGHIRNDETVTVQLAPGDYFIQKSLELTAEDSGGDGAPVTWCSAPTGRARVLGGTPVPASRFHPVTEAAALKRLPEDARGKVLVADVADLLPASLPAMKGVFGDVTAAPLFYAGHAPLTLARWPNTGWTSFTNATDTGYFQKPLSHTDTSTVEVPEKPHPGAFIYDNPRAARWDFAAGVWMNGYWTHDWDNRNVRAASYDPAKKEIRLAEVVTYGVNRGTWGRKERRFYVFNLLEELDAPGEWYLDRAAKRLYYYPPAGKDGELMLSLLDQPLLKLSPGAKHIRFERLTFEYSYGTGLELNGIDDVQVNGCTIANMGHGGITLSGNDSVIRSCDLFNLGTYGISIAGGDRLRLINGNDRIINNDIHDFARFQQTYAAGIHINGCGHIIRNNAIHNAPHCAVLYSGNEHLFEGNDVYRVVLETDDAGAFYSGRDWTTQGNILRHNFVHELGSGNFSEGTTMAFYFDDCDCGDAVIGNIFWKVSRGIMIGGGRDHPVLNNIFADCSIGLSIDSRGMTWKYWNNTNDPSWCLDAKARVLNYTQPPWSWRYPNLARIMANNPREPLDNPLVNNVFINCTQETISLDGNVRQLIDKLVITNNLVVSTSGTNAVTAASGRIKGVRCLASDAGELARLGFRDAARGDFSLAPDAPLLKAIPGFEAIPLKQIGLFHDAYRR